MTKFLPIIVCAWLATAQAATYYVSSSSGNDANPGTKAQPWAKAPGMKGFAGTYVHAAGDHIILKGGDTWTAQANCLWEWSNSGTFANPDYIGVDVTWFVGGSFTQPTIDGQWADFNGGVFNDMFRPLGSNLQVDNIHWTRLYWNSTQTYQQVAYILENSTGNNTNFIVSNCVFDNWKHGVAASAGVLTCIVGAQGSGFYDLGNMITNCVFDGLSTANSTDFQATGNGIYLYGGKVINCTFRNMCNSMTIANNGANGWCEISGFNIGPIWNGWPAPSGAEHDNGLRIPQGSGTIPIHNGYIHDTSSAMFFWGDSGETEKVYNVLGYNPRQSPVFFIDPLSASGGKTFTYNSTFYATGHNLFEVPARGPTHTYEAASSINNHLISVGAVTNYSTTLLNHFTNTTSVSQSLATATAQGYTLANLYQPINTTVDTYNAGTDISAVVPETATDILGVARPQTARWDAGAYEFFNAGPGTNLPPNTPSNVSPANLATGVSLTPTLTGTPYSDPQSNPQSDSQWTIYDSAGVTIIYDSGVQGVTTNLVVPPSTLMYSTTYKWTVRYKNTLALWSTNSALTEFTTLAAVSPVMPVNITPANGTINVSIVPILTASAYSDTNVPPIAQQAANWVVVSNAVTILDTTNGASSFLSVPSSVLTYTNTYSWKVRYQSLSNLWSSFSSATAFTTVPPTPPVTSTVTLLQIISQ